MWWVKMYMTFCSWRKLDLPLQMLNISLTRPSSTAYKKLFFKSGLRLAVRISFYKYFIISTLALHSTLQQHQLHLNVADVVEVLFEKKNAFLQICLSHLARASCNWQFISWKDLSPSSAPVAITGMSLPMATRFATRGVFHAGASPNINLDTLL